MTGPDNVDGESQYWSWGQEDTEPFKHFFPCEACTRLPKTGNRQCKGCSAILCNNCRCTSAQCITAQARRRAAAKDPRDRARSEDYRRDRGPARQESPQRYQRPSAQAKGGAGGGSPHRRAARGTRREEETRQQNPRRWGEATGASNPTRQWQYGDILDNGRRGRPGKGREGKGKGKGKGRQGAPLSPERRRARVDHDPRWQAPNRGQPQQGAGRDPAHRTTTPANTAQRTKLFGDERGISPILNTSTRGGSTRSRGNHRARRWSAGGGARPRGDLTQAMTGGKRTVNVHRRAQAA